MDPKLSKLANWALSIEYVLFGENYNVENFLLLNSNFTFGFTIYVYTHDMLKL